MTDTTGPEPKARRSVTYQRPKQTRKAVLFADRFADRSITLGGLLVILAVFTIMVFLIWICLPLLNAGEVTDRQTLKLASHEETYAATQADEYLTAGIDVTMDGKVNAFHLGTGESFAAQAFDLGGARATAVAKTLKGADIVFGFADGTVRVGALKLLQNVIPTDQAPADRRKLDERDSISGDALYSQVPGQLRRTRIATELEAPIQIAPAGTAILKADYRVGGTAERPTKAFVTMDANGEIRLSLANTIINMMTGEGETEVTSATIPANARPEDVVKLLLNTDATRVIVALKSGRVLRYDTRDFRNPRLAETAETFSAGGEMTSISYLNGEQSLVIGGSDGSTSVWFGVDRKSPDTLDGIVLTQVHGGFEAMPAAVTEIRVSQRTRLFTTTDLNGRVWVRHATTERTLLKLDQENGPAPLAATLFAPRDDGVIGITKDGTVTLWRVSIPHPETTLQSLFGKVWYEGYAEPDYVWQSTSGQDSFEPKLSLIPLIFGTLKAAIYSLLLAVPIALMAAIYTSEFLHWKVRAVVKPIMELMATLPSVVIGFVAALVLSPIVENWIAAVVIAFAVIPLTLIASAFLWQLLPEHLALRLEGVPKLILFFVAVGLAVWGSAAAGPLIETALFGGDFRGWTGGEGSGQPFLFLILIPISAFLVFLASRAIGDGIGYRSWLRQQAGPAAGAAELLRWILLITLTLALAWLLAGLLSNFGYDVRGGFVDTYVQRNTLIAAFAISFAEIPIIYTIAEDALNSVPEHLRSGSLACGASRWQTARWVVVPTAGSGIFSAIMIGLGRAVGETMIVVMATGNTPVTDFNIFNGLRALSANINVELPEAVRDSTLYRTLFLCALTLFILTFVINTIAEIVRQRFRKRAAQL